MTVPELPLAHFAGKIIRGEPFAFSRWGDGEWFGVLRKASFTTPDQHPLTPEICRELGSVLRGRPPYALGMQPLAQAMMGLEIDDWLRSNQAFDLAWTNADVFHAASMRGLLDPLLYALRRRILILVGPSRLGVLFDLLGYASLITVPERNCESVRPQVEQRVREALRNVDDVAVVSFSAGVSTNLAIDSLYREFGGRHILLDAGSLWDPFSGKATRRYHGPILESCCLKSGVRPPKVALRPQGARSRPPTRLPLREGRPVRTSLPTSILGRFRKEGGRENSP